MHNIYSALGISEDDVVFNVRYCVIYLLHEGILDLSEEWIHQPIVDRFRSYTHENAVHLNGIGVDQRDSIVFDLQLMDPEISIQEIVDEIYDILCEQLPWPQKLAVDPPWREVRIFTVGTPESVEEDIRAYIETIRRSQSGMD